MANAEQWTFLAKVNDIALNTIQAVKISDLELALYNIDGQYYCTHNVCTHANVLLSDGWLEGDIIECPLHGGRFEVKSGKGLGAPITCDLKTYQTRVVDGSIEVLLG
jgi:nitrite reductase/ring-hydroxylating ferredoxin subunit